MGMIRPMIGRARASILAAASRRRLGDAAIRPGSSVIGVTVMVGTDPAMRGGIASVVSAYRDGGFFEWARVHYIASHVDGGALAKTWRFLCALVSLTRTLAASRVSLVHAHVSSKGSFWRKALLLWVARRFGVPTICHLHSGGFADFAARGWGGPVLRAAIRSTLESSSAVVVLSERWAAWAREFAPLSRVRVIGNPVHVPSQPIESRSVGPGEGGRVLYLGLVCEAKGCFDLLRAWSMFRSRVPGWRLAIGGNGEIDRLLAEARRLGIAEDIAYLGWVSGAAKERELSCADVFVLPSYKEGMPVSILEAMAYGAAVIATPVGGVPDMMVPDVHGLWFEPGDVAALAQCLERLAGSPDLRRRLSQAARERVLAHYRTETVLDGLKSLYLEVAQVR